MADNFPTLLNFRVSTTIAAQLTQLCELTGESASAVHRRALDQLLRSELPHRLAEQARKNAA